ncbi:MAG: YciI family protein [Myxococcales bacterium]
MIVRSLRPEVFATSAVCDTGKLVVAGPLGDQDDKTARGIGLWRASLDEARRLSSDDPAVKAGVFKVEAMTWSTEKGALAFPVADRMKKE